MSRLAGLLASYTPSPQPVLGPTDGPRFDCPVSRQPVTWAAKDVFNPGAVVRDGVVHLLVRGEDDIGRYAGTSRVGLATSTDGITFSLETEPVLFPDEEWQAWEWPGGCEDPRIVEAPDGTYVCTYTGFNGRTATLMVATSPDLRTWTKHGPAFLGTPHAARWSKSGAVLTEVADGRLVAARVRDRYWMYWGEGVCFAATSTDLVRWTPVQFDVTDRLLQLDGAGRWRRHAVPGVETLRPIAHPRFGRWDSLLVEPGPPAVRTDDGIVLLYNGANVGAAPDGDPDVPPFAYQPGWLVLDRLDPLAVVERAVTPLLDPAAVGGAIGQVSNVCFAQALVLFEDRWHLYYGLADSRIGVATAPFER